MSERKPMEKMLKKGDRIAAYVSPNGIPMRNTGTVIRQKGDVVHFAQENGTHHCLHRKQVRRLKPKAKRRVWISEANTAHVLGDESSDMGMRVHVWNTRPAHCDTVEFVEVRRGK